MTHEVRTTKNDFIRRQGGEGQGRLQLMYESLHLSRLRSDVALTFGIARRQPCLCEGRDLLGKEKLSTT